ncbi:MAG: PD-(D/E)XK nuclease family protein, partial [Candidatus Poseidoniales archaeon]|nr:PD-(D/E)XK nuclease family protein [Candidatus Poseidoniales archaeon]
MPVLVFGHAVEECVCRVLRENPSLVAANAVTEAFDSPTKEQDAYWRRRNRLNTIIDQRPEAAWKGPLLIPTGESFDDIESIREWALERIAVHWPRAIASAYDSWLGDSNRSGDWDEFMATRGHLGPQLAASGIDMHLEEVAHCFAAGGGAGLGDFRYGKRGDIPAPDGFPANYGQPHPCANLDVEGEVSLLEAWELARPWFVDPDAGDFTQQAILPDGWFQGEYDLVYRWEGTSRIVDLKASDGRSEWAASYPVQMQTYAWLWWASHGKDEEVSGLETWYLGNAARKVYQTPSTAEMEKFEGELHDFWEQHIATKGSRNIADYPPQPANVPSFTPGGGEQVGEADASERCRQCYWAGECEGSGRKV